MKNKFLLVILMISLVFTSKSFVLCADSNDFGNEIELIESDIEDNEFLSKYNNADDEIFVSEMSDEYNELELETVFETELESETELETSSKSKHTEDFDDVLSDNDNIEIEEINIETETEEENIVDIETINDEINEKELITDDFIKDIKTKIANLEKNNNKNYGSDGRKLYFVYFKEDMSDFDYFEFTNDDSDAVTVANNKVEAIPYYDKRYNGIVDLGIYPFNAANIRDNYKWDDQRIYNESPQSIYKFFDNWKINIPQDETIICANYAKLTEMSITKHTIDTEYEKGEKFSPAGLKIEVKYGNGVEDKVDYSDATKNRFKFYNNDTGEELTTDTEINNDFTLKVVYGDLEHGDVAISVVESTLQIYCIDPAVDKGLRVFYQTVDETIKYVTIGKSETAEEFTNRVAEIINSDDVKSDNHMYQGYYDLANYTGDDYEPFTAWDAEGVKYFNATFKDTINKWINEGRVENKSLGIVFQKRDRGIDFDLKIFYLNNKGEKVVESYYENTNMEEFDTVIENISNNIPPKYSKIRSYYNSTWTVIDDYDPDRNNAEVKLLPDFEKDFRLKMIEWKQKAKLYGDYDKNIFLCYERKSVDSIEISNKPEKTNYQTDDLFDPSGLRVKVKYTDDKSEPYYEEIEYNDNKNLFSFEPSLDTKLNDTYDRIKITCLEKDVYANIFVEPEIASISICRNIKYDTYSVGEKFNPDSLEVLINFKNGDKKLIDYNTATVSILKFNPPLDYELKNEDEGIKQYNIGYGSKTTTVNINVLKNEKFIIFYEENNIVKSAIFKASESNVRNKIDEILKIGYGGFYAMTSSKYNESIKIYNKNDKLVLNKDKLLNTYDQFDGKYNMIFGAVVVKPTPTPTPTPVNPGRSSDGGGSSGGGGGSGLALNQQVESNNVPSVISINMTKNIKDVLLKNTCKWNYDNVNNKWKLVALNMFSMNIDIKNGFYLVSNLNEDLINTINNTYCFDINGNMITGFVNTFDNKTYYFEHEKNVNEGAMVFGWKKIQNFWYLFNPDGSMVKNSITADGYYLGADGKLVER